MKKFAGRVLGDELSDLDQTIAGGQRRSAGDSCAGSRVYAGGRIGIQSRNHLDGDGGTGAVRIVHDRLLTKTGIETSDQRTDLGG